MQKIQDFKARSDTRKTKKNIESKGSFEEYKNNSSEEKTQNLPNRDQ